MMRLRSIIGTGCLLALLTHAGQVLAATPEPTATLPKCRERVLSELTTVHDIYRAYIYGSVADKDNGFVVKTGGYVNKGWPGILETKKRLTPELVQPIVQSYKSYRCHALAVCAAMKASLNLPMNMAVSPLQIQVLGCDEETIPTYEQCELGSSKTDPGTLTSQQQELKTFCNSMVEDTLTVERAELKAAVSYDTGYRALLQFAGIMEKMLRDIPNFSFEPLRQMAGLLGKLHTIPCFIGQCDMHSDPTIR